MRGFAVRFPILVAIGLTIGLLIGLALANFLWVAVGLIAALAAFRLSRRYR